MRSSQPTINPLRRSILDHLAAAYGLDHVELALANGSLADAVAVALSAERETVRPAGGAA